MPMVLGVHALHLDLDLAVLADREIKLGNLIALGQVGIKIVLAGKPVFPVEGAIGGQAKFNGRFHHLAVEYRQGARHA